MKMHISCNVIWAYLLPNPSLMLSVSTPKPHSHLRIFMCYEHIIQTTDKRIDIRGFGNIQW